jgi:hypothetical protein
MLSRGPIVSTQRITLVCAFQSMAQDVLPFASLRTPCFSASRGNIFGADVCPRRYPRGGSSRSIGINGVGYQRDERAAALSLKACQEQRGGAALPGPEVKRADGPVNVPKRLPPGGASSFWDRARERERLGEGPRPTEVLQLGAAREHSATVRREIFFELVTSDRKRGLK